MDILHVCVLLSVYSCGLMFGQFISASENDSFCSLWVFFSLSLWYSFCRRKWKWRWIDDNGYKYVKGWMFGIRRKVAIRKRKRRRKKYNENIHSRIWNLWNTQAKEVEKYNTIETLFLLLSLTARQYFWLKL